MSALKVCPVCSTEYPANERFCPRDGTALRSQGGATDLVGTVIAERYHVLKKLGEGGMGQVYLAEHVKMGRKSAVKVMNPGMVDNVDAISRFNREAANASRINHPNVAGIYDFGETPDGLIYMAMEFVEGEALTNVIRAHGALPPLRASEIARQTAEGLAVAHDMGIVHRDLKPDNIMIAKGRGGSDLVKVVDFGIAKAAASDNQKVTKTGMVVGTPEYMSPEQLSGDPLDARSDIYSLGLVTFAMLTGKLPFPSDSAQETMIMRLTDKPKTLSEMKPDLKWPGAVQLVIDRVLERDANLRYKTATEFAVDLVQAIDKMSPVTNISAVATNVLSAAEVQAHAQSTNIESATKRISAIPKTRVAEKAEIAKAAVEGQPKTSKGLVWGSVGGVVVVGGLIAFMVMKPTTQTGGVGTNSAAPPAGTSSPGGPSQQSKSTDFKSTLPPGTTPPAAIPVDSQLYLISSRIDNLDSTDVQGYRKVLSDVNELATTTPKQNAYADLIRGQAMLRTGDVVKACAKLSGLLTSNDLSSAQQLTAQAAFEDAKCKKTE